MKEKEIYQALYEELKKIKGQLENEIYGFQDLKDEIEDNFSYDRKPYLGKDLMQNKKRIESLEKELSQEILLEVSRLR